MAALLGWSGHRWWTEGRFIESTDNAYVGGNVTAIAPHVGGFVKDVLIEDHQRVHAGQVLIRLDRRDCQAALDHAAALVDAREAALERLWRLAHREASTLAYADAFRAVMLAFAAATLLVPFLRKVGAPSRAPGAH